MRRKKTKTEKYFERYRWLEQELELFPDTSVAKVSKEEVDRIRKSVEKIKEPLMRDIVRLHFIGGVSYVEVAEQLFYSHATVCKKAYKFYEKADKNGLEYM